MRRAPILALIAVAVTTAHLPVSRGQDLRVINPAWTKLTDKQIVDFVAKAGKVELNVFSACAPLMHVALASPDAQHLTFDARGCMGSGCDSVQPASVANNTISGRCTFRQTPTGDPPSGGGSFTFKFEARIRAVADGQMRYDLKTCDGPKCTPEAIATDDEGCVLTSTKEQYFCGPDLEIIPGAADHALFDKVVLSLRSSRIKDWKAVSSDFSYLPQLFAGPQARKPREESEVFFSRSAGDAGKNEAAAQVTAKVLEPIIGPVAVKAWPGPWDYHVVVVVGSKAGADKKAE